MSKSKKKAPAKQSTKQKKPAPTVQQPTDRKFGTNPATNERHVHVEPELMPQGPGSYLDSAETMLA